MLCIDLFCGLGGWTEGFLAEGWDCIGFDIERHDYGRGTYPGQLVLGDVLGLWGSQFAKADCIVASPPCQTYSYMAMPWSRAKALAAWYREHELRQVQLNALFNACFRIQREACAAAGRHIPMVVENVKGAQPWVGVARAHFGSFYFWGDIGMVGNQVVCGNMAMGQTVRAAARNRKNGGNGSWWAISHGVDNGQMYGANPVRGDGIDGVKNDGGSWFNVAHNTESGCGQNPDGRLQSEGTKQRGSGREWFDTGIAALPSGSRGTKVSGDWFGSYADMKENGTISPGRLHGKGSQKRKAASAEIAKIPFPLASYIARAFKPVEPRGMHQKSACGQCRAQA